MHSAVGPSSDLALIQIEEPAAQGEQDSGLAIGFELTAYSLRVAIAVGGNAEILSAESGLDYLSARVSESDGADLAVGIDALRAPEIDPAHSIILASGLQSILVEARRSITMRAQRLVTGAVAVVPPGLDRRTLAIIMGAVEGADMALLGLIETPVALAYADGLDRRSDGVYRMAADGQDFWLSVDDGVIRLVPETAGATPITLRIPPEHAVLGAALLAETRNAEQS